MISEELSSGIAELKRAPGSYILAHGGTAFVHSLIAADLVDEYRLLVHPVALGRGEQIFSHISNRRNLLLDKARAFEGGSVAMTLQPCR